MQSSPDDSTAQHVLTLSGRGMAVLQDLLGIMRDNDRVLLALLERNRILEQLAWTDSLTGLRNRRGFDEEMAREEARIARFKGSAAVALVDVSGLKTVNDRYGQLVGDALIRTVAGALRVTARESDCVARFGGDEFAALLPGADRVGCASFLARLLANAGTLRLKDGNTLPIALTSAGASIEEAGSLAKAMDLASRRLAEEKAARSHTVK